MVRPFILILLVLLSACASKQPVRLAPVKPPEVTEPLDPSIKPLSQELEEAGQQKRGPA